jgi:C4-dicarboxylate-specific signal transduction histidine kinase
MILQDEVSIWINGGDRLFGGSENSSIEYQLLACSGRRNFNFASPALNEVIKETIQTLKSAIPGNVSINFALQSDLPVFMADATQLRQVVTSLVTNACEAIGTSEVG